MSTAWIERLIIFAVLIAGLSPCIPVAAKARNRRQEKRILASPVRRPKRAPRKFRTGYIPTHERCFLLPGEAEVFRMITDAEWAPDPKSYRWIGAALKPSQKARRP